MAVLAELGASPFGLLADSTHLYWLEAEFVARCRLDGSELQENLVAAPGATGALGLDVTHLYWFNEPTNSIGRAALDGSEPEPEWIKETGGLGQGIAIAGAHIFWTNGSGHIARAKTDGTEVEPEWLLVENAPLRLVTDGVHLYWQHEPEAIGRVKLDGTELIQEWLVGLAPFWFTVIGGVLYWVDGSGSGVGRWSGGALEPEWLAVYGELLGVAVEAGQVYWVRGAPNLVVGLGAEAEEPKPDPPPAGGSYIEGIRERPPLRLNLDVASPDGRHTRWGWDDPDPGNAPMGLSFSSVMPGGFERLSAVLERDSRLTYPDLAELSTITARGAGGDIAWQGRLEKTPDTGGFQQQVQPEAVGWQAHLEDDNTARERYVDLEQAGWGEPPNDRKIALLNGTYGALISPDSTSNGAPDSGGISSLITQVTGAWETRRVSEGWYDSAGIPIGLLKYVWMLQAAGKIGDDVTTDPNFEWRAKLTSSSTDGAPSDETGNLRGAGPEGSGTVVGSALSETLAYVQLFYTAAGLAGTDGVVYPVFWPVLAVYGRHGLPLYGTLSKDGAPGVLSSDAVANALGRWAPKLTFTTGVDGTVKPSTFIVPQLAFAEPTTVAEMVKQATRFELPDWAVWEGPAFYMNPRGERGKHWRARVGPAQLQQAGPQVARLWNGVIVSYSDSAGVQRTVGPPGSGAEATSGALIDEDPENPLNQIGIRRWAPLKMGTSSLAGATQVGAIFLREQAQLETSGQATIIGHVEDESGVLYPAWAIRAGDTIAFVDASDSSPRRVVHAGYDEPTRGCQVQLDQPPDSLTAILERLSVSIQPLGLS